MLSIASLSVSFCRYNGWFEKTLVTPIKNLTLEAQKGDITVILGQSGAGKSLLADSIMGILPTNARVTGKMFYDGKELNHETIMKKRRREFALLPQAFTYLNPWQTIETQLKISANLAKIDKKYVKDRIPKIFKELNLEIGTLQKYPFQISGGMAKKVLISMILLCEREFIIADEPTNGLDEDAVEEFIKIFLNLKSSRCGILLITHDVNLALKCADKIFLFNQGETLETLSVEDINKLRFKTDYAKQYFKAYPQFGFEVV